MKCIGDEYSSKFEEYFVYVFFSICIFLFLIVFNNYILDIIGFFFIFISFCYFFKYPKNIEFLRCLQKNNPNSIIVLLYGYTLTIALSITELISNFASKGDTNFFQTLATIQFPALVLLVTLTIVVVQLGSANYASRFTQFLKYYIEFWFLILLFLDSILFDIVNIQFIIPDFIPNFSNIKIGLLLIVFALFSIVPFIYNIITILRPENQLSILQIGIETHKDDDPWILGNHLMAIFDIIIGSIKKNDISTITEGIRILNVLIENDTLDFEKEEIEDIFRVSLNIIEIMLGEKKYDTTLTNFKTFNDKVSEIINR